MKLNEQQLNEVTAFGEQLFDPEAIAIILQVNCDEFMAEIQSKEGPVYLAYMKGILLTQSAIRKATITFAKQGSVPALSAANKYMEELKMKLLKSA